MVNMFELKNVWKVYSERGVKTEALKGINLEIKKKEYAAIYGPSGSGKSTLMHITGCLDTPTKGKVFVSGKDVSKLSSDKLAEIRRKKIGFVFQAYNLIPTLTTVENISLPMRFNGKSKTEAEKKSQGILKEVGLGHRLKHKANELSGGEQQRVAIARALANDPEVILADEPTGNLDTKTGNEIIKLIHDLNKNKGKTVIVVTHEAVLARKAKRQILIKDGKIVSKKGK